MANLDRVAHVRAKLAQIENRGRETTNTLTTFGNKVIRLRAARGTLASLDVGEGRKLTLDAADARELASMLMHVATVLDGGTLR